MKINILMDGGKMCIAFFRKKKYTLTTGVDPTDGGTITAGGRFDKGTVVEVEAIPADNYEFDHWEGDVSNKWLGLGMGLFGVHASYIDMLLANGFETLRISIPNYQNTAQLANSKTVVIDAIAKGAKVIWGVTSNKFDNPDYEITAANWEAFRTAIKDAAQWAQDNGVYEFQIGNEETYHNDKTTMTDAQLIVNLKSVATEVKAIFTNGDISYSCGSYKISDWVIAGRGDIDLLAANIYKLEIGSTIWQTDITDLVAGFGADHTYITEFNLNGTSLDTYSTDETVQAAGVTEMIEYIKASGITRALFFCWKSEGIGVLKDDGTYRLLWNSLLNLN